MFQVPSRRRDQRANSLCTNRLDVLAMRLSYRYLISEWQARVDEIAGILRETIVGGLGQPSFGCYCAGGARIRRPKYHGAQMDVWDAFSSVGVTNYCWLREATHDYVGLPPDDSDCILCTVETTGTFAMVYRVHGYNEYGWLFGPLGTNLLPPLPNTPTPCD